MHIHSTAGTVAWTPPSLEEHTPKPSFTIAVATPADTDQLGYEMYRRNVIPVTQETLRATLIDELFELYPEDKANEFADVLEEVWQSEEIFQTDLSLWMDQERERLRDEAAGAPKREKTAMPKRHVSVRARAKSQLLMDEVTGKSQRIRDLSVQMNSYPRRQAAMVLRMQIKDWSGLKVKVDIADDILTEECLAALFAEIGQEAYRELERHISAMYELSGEEEGNSDSLLANELLANGSPEPSADTASSDGNLSSAETLPIPQSNTGQAPEGGSAETTETSSTSTSG